MNDLFSVCQSYPKKLKHLKITDVKKKITHVDTICMRKYNEDFFLGNYI